MRTDCPVGNCVSIRGGIVISVRAISFLRMTPHANLSLAGPIGDEVGVDLGIVRKVTTRDLESTHIGGVGRKDFNHNAEQIFLNYQA